MSDSEASIHEIEDQNGDASGELLAIYCLFGSNFLSDVSVTDINASEANDGQGIRYVISFTPFLKDSKKKRKKTAPTVAKALYLHERTKFIDFLDQIFTLLKRHDLAITSYNHEDFEVNKSVCSISYTIPRHVTTPLSLSSRSEYRDMLKQAMKKGCPEVKVSILKADVS